jgi:DNA replicative helicase MCM subunit Mcm2 (Cdc46/Mcm family)
VLDIIDELEKKIGKQIPVNEIKAEAEDKGISERDAGEVVDQLKKEGRLFEVRLGQVQKLW